MTIERQEWELMSGGAREAFKGALAINVVAIRKRKVQRKTQFEFGTTQKEIS
jgi:hypothetical protein